ncbi:MAG: beta strand repeat-containing protein [Candidatus Kapaibacterium sp.]
MMKQLRTLVLKCCVASALTLQLAVPAFSQTAIPRQMSYQGVLREGDKVANDGMYAVKFSMYSRSEGGVALWSEVQTVELRGGLFNVILGQFMELPSQLPSEVWLGMSINSSPEMPRTKLTSVPFALMAGSAQALSGDATGAVLSLNGQQGTIELRATDGFEVRADKGVLTIGKTSSAKEEEVLNQGTEWLLAGNTNATTSHWLGTSNDIPLIVKTNNTERLRVQSTGNGNVGIGETNPGSRLTVARTFHLTNAGGAPELKLSAASGSASTTFKTGTQLTSVTYTLPSSAPSSNGQVLTSTTTGLMTWSSPVANLAHFTEGFHNAAPNAAITVASFTPKLAVPNMDVAIVPKGTGALLADIPDGTATGGDKRGQNAVDLQTSRNLASQVASGDWSTVSGGVFNTASGDWSTVSGGIQNTTSGSVSTVSGGVANTASGDNSSILGGSFNTAGGDNSSILGGRGLTLSGSGSIGYLGNNNDGTRNMTVSAANTAVFGNVDLWLVNNDNTAHELRMYEASGSGSNYTAFKAGVQGADIVYTLPTSAGSNGQVLTTNGSGVLSWTTASGGGLQYFIENRNTTAPNATVPVHQLAATGTEADIDLTLSPKGDGALTAQRADGTLTGGNKRGQNAVDLQTSRNLASQVASGNRSTVSGGYQNTASGYSSIVSGGYQNTASGSGSIVSGGYLNTASDHHSIVSGGYLNTASGYSSTVSGGYQNTASGGYSSVLGGRGLTLSGSGSIGYLGNNNDGTRNMTISAANTAVFGNVDLWLVNNDNTAHELRMYEASGSGSNYTAFKAGAQSADIVYTLPTNAGSNGQVLTTNGSGVLSWGIVGFQYFTENRNAIAPNTSRPVHQLMVSGDESDIDLALSPKGDGALAASVANGIPSGGNKRGAGAVDWQTRRNAAEFVASGIGAVLGGGTDNTASGMNAVVAGGQGNVAAGTNSAILGGRGLTLSGSGSVGFLGKNTGGHNMNVSAINTAVFGNVDMWLINNDSVSREMRFYEKSSSGNNYTAFKAQDQAANVTYSLPSGDGTNGQVLTTNGSGALYWSSAGSGALTHFTESVNTAAPNATIPIVRLLATNGATNADIALSPKGMGALTADPADNTATGGNKRGAKAIDWQMQRTSAVQVACGDNSVIGGGSDNAAIGQYAVAAGGYNNNAAGYANAIGGGAGNFGNASFATIAGGSTNTASATYASVGGGDDNTASGIYSVVSGGFNNIAAGFSASINGGNANEVHGQYSAINGGELNIINGDYSAILGGNGLTLQADRSIGYNANNQFGTRAMSVNAPNTAVFNNVDFWITNNDNTTRSLRFYEQYNTDGAFPNSTNYIGFKAPNAINTDIIWTLPAADGTNGQVLTTNGAGQLTWASGSATLQNFAETVNNAAPNTAVPVVQFTPTNSATNVDIALTPKGNGSLAAHSATATAAGGNKRGANAVDWQTLRSLATEIASGTAAVIGGGGGNTASGTYSTIAGGLGNRSTQGYATIGGGTANAVNGAYSTIGGGVNNTINAGSSAIPGGSGLTLNGTGSFGFLSNHAGTNAMAIAENNVAVFANTNLWLANNDANPSELRFYEANTVTNGNFPPAALNYTAFKAQPQTANIVYTLPPNDGNAGQILATDGTGMLSWADASAGALSHFVESYHSSGDNGAVTVSRLSASTATANVDIALSPRGVGSLLANLPDGTATGGNKRGQNAVDWQLSRNSNLQVASGNFATISGGQYNTASGAHSVIGGGLGNTGSTQYTTISGGQNNTASSTWATVSGGFNNSATGSSSVVIGGFGNIAGGENTTILGGRGLNLNGDGNIGFLGNNAGGPRNMTLNTSNTAVFANVDMWLINNDNTAHELRIYEASGDGDQYTAFKAQPQTETITYSLPATAPPATDYVMTVQESSGNNATLGWGKRIIQLQDTPVDCANLNGGGGNATVDITVTDAVVGGTVHVSPRQAMEGGVFIAYAFIPSNGTVRIMFINATAGDIDPDSVNMDITVIQP